MTDPLRRPISTEAAAPLRAAVDALVDRCHELGVLPARRVEPALRHHARVAAQARRHPVEARRSRVTIGWRTALVVLAGWAGMALTFSSGCSDPVAPFVPGRTALVIGGETSSVRLIDVERGVVTARLASSPRGVAAYALSADSSTLFFTSVGHIWEPRVLVEVDVSHLSVRRSEELTIIAGRARSGEAVLYASHSLDATTDGRYLALDGARDGILGLWTVDLATWVPRRFWGPLDVAPQGIVALPPSPRYPGGGLAVVGRRGTGSTSPPPHLFVLDADSLAVLDSVSLPMGARDVHAVAGGEQLVLASFDSVFWYDVQSARIVAGSRRGDVWGRVSCGPTGDVCYEADPGDLRDWPGSGKVYRHDRALGALPPFSIDPDPLMGHHVVNHVAVSRDGTAIYVVTGPPALVTYTSPPGGLFVLDRMTGALRRRILIGEWRAEAVVAF